MIEAQIEKIRRSTVEIVKTYFTEDLGELLIEIAKLERDPIVAKNANLIEELKVYKCLLLFVDFPTLSEEKQLWLFRNALVKALRVGIDVRERFIVKMNVLDPSLWAETAQPFVEAIIQNEERVGREGILIQGEASPTPPIIKNWLRDYNRIYGMDKHEKIIMHQYMTESKNVARLNQEEKIVLLKVLELYESLKFPTQSQFVKAFEDYLNQNLENLEQVEQLFVEEGFVDQGVDPISQMKEDLIFNDKEIVTDNLTNLMKKFPKIFDQEITEKPIKLLYSEETVRPTIENWLSDYSSFAGANDREITDRSSYLLRSPNVSNLKLEERVRLGLILRSVDEGYPLPFSLSSQKIIFSLPGRASS